MLRAPEIFRGFKTCLVLIALGFTWLAEAQPGKLQPLVSLVVEPEAGQPAQHGLGKIISALADQKVPFERIESIGKAQGKFLIVTGLAAGKGSAAFLLRDFHASIPVEKEALTILKTVRPGKPTWLIAGADERGLMYGEFEVADRIRWSTNSETPLSELREISEKPETRTRGISLFTMNRAYWESRFYDEAYWMRYLDTLAQNRFNSLVVILGYENGGFMAPSYPYFFDLPEFPEVKMIGITPAQQQQNVAALNRLIALAHARGIDFTIGLWDHIYRGNVQNGGSVLGNDGLRGPTPGLVWGMNATNLIPYNQAALKQFLKRFPGIDGLQFRMHDESGLKPGEQGRFWKAMFQTIREAAPKLPLDLRAKGLTAEEIQSAIDSGVNFRISTKYWMEQMGLPFHPAHINERDQGNRRHSYADLLVYPPKYRMNWQLWSGGTTRILLWGDPDYARRFVESTDIYEHDGFEVNEPLATKMEGQPHDLKPFDLLKPSARYYNYEFERYWHFFQVFGRLGYNPQTPAEAWNRDFEKRFGSEVGPILENALHRASWILPRIIASSYPYGGFPMTAGWAEKQHLGDLPGFAKATLSEVQIFENFDEEAQLLIEGGETAKVRPQETSHWFAQVSDDIDAQIQSAEKKIGAHRNKEFASTVLDLKILSCLARYHSQRIPAAVSYRLYDRTKNATALDDAIRYEREAVTAWRQMVEVAGDTYAEDLMFGARSRNLCGHWKIELVSLEKGLAALVRQQKEIQSRALTSNSSPHFEMFNAQAEVPVILHQPVTSSPASKSLTIRARVSAPSGIKWVQVLYRSVDQTKDYETLTMTPVDENGNYEAVIPAEKINPHFDFMYFLQAMDHKHRGVMYPDFNRQTPYFIVRLERGGG